MDQLVKARLGGNLIRRLVSIGALFTPAVVLAQASPCETGANSLVTFAQTIGTPIAALIIIGLAIAAGVGKMSLPFGSARRSILRRPGNAGLFEADHQSCNLIWTRRKDA